MDTEPILDLETMKTAISQMLEAAPDKRLSEDQISTTLDALADIAIDAGIWHLWETGKVTISHDPDDKIRFTLVDD